MTRFFLRTIAVRRIAVAAIMAVTLALAAGCTEYDVPGGDKPWPKLGVFPEKLDDEAMAERRQRALGQYDDPEKFLPEPANVPSHPPFNALRVAVIYFPRGQRSLDPASLDVLAQVAAYAQQSRGTVWLFGHASLKIELVTAGNAVKTRRKLSASRVKAVALSLLKGGVPLGHIRMISRGAADPAYRETKPAGEAGNRRVEIYFTRG